jgi:putative hydroxymethylpyrimidine transport system ATP-binding protein
MLPTRGHLVSATPLSFTIHVDANPYGGTPLFAPFSLTFPAASWTCFLGSSGVGKSTLLRLLAGLHQGQTPDSGCVIDVADGKGLDGRLSYMAQQDLLMPWLSALGNVTIGDRLRGHQPDMSRAESLLVAAGLAEHLHHRPARLSGGQRQRIALVRTLYEDRPVVLMDEPFSALDPLNRLRLQDLAAEFLCGRTVILVTHDPLEALRLGDRVIALQGQPASPATALVPPGQRPRDVTDPALTSLQGQLLARLGGV